MKVSRGVLVRQEKTVPLDRITDLVTGGEPARLTSVTEPDLAVDSTVQSTLTEIRDILKRIEDHSTSL